MGHIDENHSLPFLMNIVGVTKLRVEVAGEGAMGEANLVNHGTTCSQAFIQNIATVNQNLSSTGTRFGKGATQYVLAVNLCEAKLKAIQSNHSRVQWKLGSRAYLRVQAKGIGFWLLQSVFFTGPLGSQLQQLFIADMSISTFFGDSRLLHDAIIEPIRMASPRCCVGQGGTRSLLRRPLLNSIVLVFWFGHSPITC